MSKDKKINQIDVNITEPFKTAICTMAGNSLRIVELLEKLYKDNHKLNFDLYGKRIEPPEVVVKSKIINEVDYSSQLSDLTQVLINRLNSIQKAIEKTKPKEKNISLSEIRKTVREQAIKVIAELEKKPTAKKKKL
tara:strand:- start:218 stop:625 length:408 start_codon:yes stop_codon:yes gene_type:complete